MDQNDLSLLTIVVQRKLGEKVVNVALKAGATGATFFYAQGTGVRQSLGFLGQFIEAEKQVVFVVVKTESVERVLDAVVEAGELNTPGQGFAYVQAVTQVVGYFQGEKKP